MEKRYQVFVSSTYVDLKEERQAVLHALLELDCFPAAMELFPASDDEKWELIKKVIDDSDLYIVIIGGRYGSVDEEGLSYTEREYNYAIETKKPAYGFVHGEPDAIPAGKTEINPEARERLARFRAKVQAKMCKPWKTTDELGAVVSRGISKAIKDTRAQGWVPGRYAADPEQIEALRRKIDELQSNVDLSATTPPQGVEHLAQGEDLVELFARVDGDRAGLGTSWDEAFKAIGPFFLDPCDEDFAAKELGKFIFRKVNKEWRDHSPPYAESDTWNTVKIQFISLNLIRRAAAETHSASGVLKLMTSHTSGTGRWVLSPYGEARLMKMRALLRPAAGK